MKLRSLFAITALVLLATVSLRAPILETQFTGAHDQSWTNYVRIAAYSLHDDNADQIVRDATESGVFGIEVDNDITGRYESFINPSEKLAAIRKVAEKAHAAHNHAFVYIAGLECITAHADRTTHTMAKEHPDWLQRKSTGEPAIFGGGSAFWISPGDEDVWISPFATEWRKMYMQRVRQIAATGIDGIYVDIPYWMTHFEGWENSWASFDDYTVAAFRERTGLNAHRDLKMGDFQDANFRRWVDFRTQTISDFMHEIKENVKEVNPKCLTIAEIYPGIEEEAVRVGADVYQLYPVVDAIAHEYEFGSGDHMASSRTPLDWFRYQVGMQSFRSFAGEKATWILNYSWDGDRNVRPGESIKNLAMSELNAGANFWDAQGHVMSGSNDLAARKAIFHWISAHEATFYRPRQPINPVGVYFSPETRNRFAKQFIRSYQGVLILLMQTHWEFQVVTPRALADFGGNTLILPDVRILDNDERRLLRGLIAKGRRIVVTGADATQLPLSSHVVRLPHSPDKSYMELLETDFDKTEIASGQELLAAIKYDPKIEVAATPFVTTQITDVDGNPHVFIANFRGLQPGANAVQTPEADAKVSIPAGESTRAYFLPFLGEVRQLRGEPHGGKMVYQLPPIEKGAVFWLERVARDAAP